jgi:hypothetical protein
MAFVIAQKSVREVAPADLAGKKADRRNPAKLLN